VGSFQTTLRRMTIASAAGTKAAPKTTEWFDLDSSMSVLATKVPKTPPIVDADWFNANARPRHRRSERSESSASVGAPRTPLATRSRILVSHRKKKVELVPTSAGSRGATANMGFTSSVMAAPTAMTATREKASLATPARTLDEEAQKMAVPSSSPILVLLMPSSSRMKTGSTEYTIRLPMLHRKPVVAVPARRTPCCLDIVGAASSRPEAAAASPSSGTSPPRGEECGNSFTLSCIIASTLLPARPTRSSHASSAPPQSPIPQSTAQPGRPGCPG
jgi:hypothetical protein